MNEDNMFYIRGRESFLPKYRCPKCGYTWYEGIQSIIDGYVGHYCTRCFAKWLSENIPKMYALDEDPAAEEDGG